MTYHQFSEELILHLTNKLPENAAIKEELITKNNGLSLRAIVISEPGCNVFPTIYTDSFYEMASNNVPMEKITDEVLSLYEDYKVEGNIDVSFLTDYKKIRSKIVCRLINKKKNEELLKDVPWMPYLDLALIACIRFDTDSDLYAGSIIHNSQLKTWDVTKEEIFRRAVENGPKLMPPELRSLPDFLNDIAGEVVVKNNDKSELMHILTNNVRTHGSVCMMYDGVLSKFAEEVGRDVFVLPSSIHEVMLLADDGRTNLEELSKLVCEVNESQVPPGDYLGEHAYLYKKDTGEIVY